MNAAANYTAAVKLLNAASESQIDTDRVECQRQAIGLGLLALIDAVVLTSEAPRTGYQSNALAQLTAAVLG